MGSVFLPLFSVHFCPVIDIEYLTDADVVSAPTANAYHSTFAPAKYSLITLHSFALAAHDTLD